MEKSVRLAVVSALLFAALVVPTPRAAAQTASLAWDFGSAEPFPGPPSGEPSGLGAFLSVGERLYFVAGQSVGVSGLWVTDGKPNGTRLVNDLCRGACPEAHLVGSLGGLAFFVAGAGTDPGGPLWRSDGTAAGTFVVSAPGRIVVGTAVHLGGRLYVLSCQGDGTACGLFTSDGTLGGTRLAAPGFDRGVLAVAGGRLFDFTNGQVVVGNGTAAGISVGTAVASLSDTFVQAVAGEQKVFFTLSSHFGTEDDLWVSDGTAAGTHLVRAFPKAQSAGGIRWLKVQGDRAYLVATDGRTELWQSDGTVSGTRQLTTFRGDDPFFASTAEQLVEAGGRVLFLATDVNNVSDLWSLPATATTAATLPPPTLLAPLCAANCLLDSARLVPTGNRVVVKTETGMVASDGTPAGTVSLPCRAGCLDAQPLPFAGAALYLTAPYQVWQTDGTTPGTRRLVDLSGDAGDTPELDWNAAPLGGRLVVTVPPLGAASPASLWVSDGTAPGTYPLLASDEGPSAAPQNLSALGDRLLFNDCSGNGELWGSSGSPETAALLLADDNFGCDAEALSPRVSLGGVAYFPRRAALWRTDGTTAGTQPVLDLASLSPPMVFTSDLFVLGNLGDRLVFGASSSGVVQLWQSDGTAAGTRALFDFPAAARGPNFFRVSGATLYFLASAAGSASLRAVWASDGTAAGTRQLTPAVASDSVPGDGSFWVAPVNGSVYFPFAQSLLWQSDGTAAGTAPFTTSGGAGILAAPPVQLGADLYFLGDSVLQQTRLQGGLWRFDGTAAGSGLIAALSPCGNDPSKTDLTVAGSRIFLTAKDGVHDCELWQSDGTETGTVRARTTAPLPVAPMAPTAAGGRVFFSATDDLHGRELWQSDGTEAGTHLVQDLAPGEAASTPDQLTVAGNRLYFTADDGSTGRELWSLPLSGPPCQPASTVLCLAAGRFAVQITWRDVAGHAGVGQAVPLSADTGTFWFFDPNNVEVIVKVLDARALDQSFWVFYGALSNVEYTLSVTDSVTGLTRRYFNPAGQLASFGDTEAFGPLGAYDARTVTPSAAAPAWTAARSAVAATPCVPGPTRLCLQGGRFAVEAAWKDFQGNTGTGTAIPLSGDTGYFWFFAPTNVEVVAKVLDGRALGGKFWFFYGALSNVEYTLSVTDTETGAVKTYKNPSGQFASVADTSAF